MEPDRPYNLQALTTSPVIIENNVWIGAKATVLQGVRIGAGAVIGAHALVRSDVRERTVVVGVPARELKTLSHNSSGPEQG
jgi:acetyltransferase-like isoleucine patch superfamily enzyme